MRFLATLVLAFAPLSLLAAIPATIHTNLGDIELSLFDKKSPITVENFIRYAKEGYYNGTIFHRTIPNFMVQGGGFTADMKQKTPTHSPIRNEASNRVPNIKYTIAMARTAAPHSATSQFFINVANNNFLDYKNDTPSGAGYAVFGVVTKGMSVVDKIAQSEVHSEGIHQDIPNEPIIIKSITIGQPH